MKNLDAIIKLRKEGKTLREIGGMFGVSRQRIFQIIGRSGPPRPFTPGQASRNAILWVYKNGAKNRGFEWGLTDDQFDLLTKSNCHYCGHPPSNTYKARGALTPFVYTGIDRQDNSKGYIPSNVVPCCRVCNRAKGGMKLEQWNQWLRRIGTYSTKVLDK